MTISLAPSIHSQSTLFDRQSRHLSDSSKLTEMLDKACIDILGAVIVAKAYTQTAALRDLPAVKSLIRKMAVFSSVLEKHNYLEQVDLKSKINVAIAALYDVEAELKIKAYAGQMNTSQNEEGEPKIP